MRADRWALVVGGIAACLAACQSPDYPPTSEGYFLRYCARCHETDGSSTTASEIAESRVDLRDPVFQRLVTDADIARIVVHGQGKMQGFDLEAAVVDSIVIHVRALALPARLSAPSNSTP